MRDFAAEMGVTHYFEGDDSGIEHIILPDQGLVIPGDVVIGADSHTCTYGALGAFSTGMGSTDMAAAMALGEYLVPGAGDIEFVFSGKLGRWVAGKDLILYTIGADRRGRRLLPGDGVHGRGHRRAAHGRPLDHVPTWPSRRAARTASSGRTRRHD